MAKNKENDEVVEKYGPKNCPDVLTALIAIANELAEFNEAAMAVKKI